MSKICFLSNHIYPFHVGGSEMVIKNISEQLVSFGHDVLVSGWDVKNDMVRENVSIKTLNSNKLKYNLLQCNFFQNIVTKLSNDGRGDQMYLNLPILEPRSLPIIQLRQSTLGNGDVDRI